MWKKPINKNKKVKSALDYSLDKVYNKDKTGERGMEHKERVNLNPTKNKLYPPRKVSNPPRISNKGAKEQQVVRVSRRLESLGKANKF